MVSILLYRDRGSGRQEVALRTARILTFSLLLALLACNRSDDRPDPAARQAGRDAYRASQEAKKDAKQAARELREAGKEFREGWNEAKHNDETRRKQ